MFSIVPDAGDTQDTINIKPSFLFDYYVQEFAETSVSLTLNGITAYASPGYIEEFPDNVLLKVGEMNIFSFGVHGNASGAFNPHGYSGISTIFLEIPTDNCCVSVPPTIMMLCPTVIAFLGWHIRRSYD